MRYWLVKSEPDAFSWNQQVAIGVEPWTGVRSHQARNNLAAMKLHDRAFFYHSNIGRQIVGIVEIVREAYPDPSAGADDRKGDWLCVDVKASATLRNPVGLSQVKLDPALADMSLIRYSRLSVAPITDTEWQHVLALAGGIECLAQATRERYE